MAKTNTKQQKATWTCRFCTGFLSALFCNICRSYLSLRFFDYQDTGIISKTYLWVKALPEKTLAFSLMLWYTAACAWSVLTFFTHLHHGERLPTCRRKTRETSRKTGQPNGALASWGTKEASAQWAVLRKQEATWVSQPKQAEGWSDSEAGCDDWGCGSAPVAFQMVIDHVPDLWTLKSRKLTRTDPGTYMGH